MTRAPGSLVVGRYQLERLIGKGGMGEVFEAIDTQSRRRVAIKWLRLGGDEEVPAELLVRFQREVRVTSTLTSRHILGIHDAGRDDASGDAFMVMDLLDGEDVAVLANRLGPLPVELAVRIVAQTCEGLGVAHAAGVIHRDIKPGNLFLARGVDSTLRTVKILDFGIARVRSSNDSADPTDLTRTGALVGSPAYMAPEQIRGLRTLDHRADVWALGIVLYRLLAGAVPHERHEGSLAGLVFAICGEPAPPLAERAPWVPHELCELIHHALQIRVDDRLASARAFADGLRPWLGDGDAITDAMLVARATDRAGSVADAPTMPRIASERRSAPIPAADPFVAPGSDAAAVAVVEDDRRSARRVRESREAIAQAKLADHAAEHHAKREQRLQRDALPGLSALVTLDAKGRAIALACGLAVIAILAQLFGRYAWGLAAVWITMIVAGALMKPRAPS